MASFKSYFPSSLYAPTATTAAAHASAAPRGRAGFSHPAAGFAAASTQEFGLDYFLKGALAGGICCIVALYNCARHILPTRYERDAHQYVELQRELTSGVLRLLDNTSIYRTFGKSTEELRRVIDTMTAAWPVVGWVCRTRIHQSIRTRS